MEEEKKEVYSVWVLPDEETEPRFRKLMEALRSEFAGPRFDPHVTVAVAANLTADEAKKMFEAACDGLKAYTATVDRVATGTFFYQCVFLLLRSTPEVMEAGEHCKNHFHCSTTTPYMPHLSLLYAELTEEEKKKAQEKAYTLDDTLDGLSFRLNRLVLCRTDTEDKTLESWEKVAAAGHFMAHFKPFTGKFYVPHMSILYGDLTEEEKKKALEKAYTLDSSLDGLDFRINRVALWITDADVGSWVKIDEHNLIS